MIVSVEDKLAALENMSSAALKEEWRRVTDAPLPRVSPRLLRLALAWEIQASAYGGHCRETIRTLDQLAAGKTRTSRATPGMRLVREWNGRAHVVTIDEGGASKGQVIRWNDKEWRSLSEVARAITGTRWSGPAFFGLKKKVAA